VIQGLKSRLDTLTGLLEFYGERCQAGSIYVHMWANPDVWLRDIAYIREVLRERCPGYVEEFDEQRRREREYREKLREANRPGVDGNASIVPENDLPAL